MTDTANNLKVKLPFLTKFIYGITDWGNTTTSTVISFFFLFFMTDVVMLPPLYITPVMLIGLLWDTINDPLIGMWADKVRTRWGRRRPFFLFVPVPFALSFIMLWWIPPFSSPLLLMFYYMLARILFDTAFTALTVPYGALAAEMTQDYDERTQLNGYRMGTSMFGGLLSAFLVPIFAKMFALPKTGYLVMAVIFSVVGMVPYFILFFRTKEKYANAPVSDLNLITGFVYTWKNRAFRYTSGIYMSAWITVALVQALFIYYVTYWMKMGNQLEYLLGIVQLAAFICIPIVVVMAKKMGKTKAYIFGMVWWVLVMVTLCFLQPTAGAVVYFIAICAGLGIAGAHVIPWSLIPDVIDDDELKTGHRREGTFYGYMVLIQKGGTAITLAILPWVLSLTGYVPNAVQNVATTTAIRVMIGVVPAIMLSISIYLAWKFPINRQKLIEIRNQIDARHVNQEI